MIFSRHHTGGSEIDIHPTVGVSSLKGRSGCIVDFCVGSSSLIEGIEDADILRGLGSLSASDVMPCIEFHGFGI